jgi:hypothetical protein
MAAITFVGDGMMKTILSALALTAALATSTSAATVSFTATTSTGVPAGFGVDIGTATWGPAPTVVDGTAGGFRSPYDQFVAPGTTGDDYFTVGSPGKQASPAIMLLSTARNTFRMLWGSIDDYNAVEFCFGATCDRVTGTDIAAGIPTNVFGSKNAIVSFSSDFNFDRISFFSNEGKPGDVAAFEFAVAPVPLPAGGLLLLGALGGIAALRRRKTT